MISIFLQSNKKKCVNQLNEIWNWKYSVLLYKPQQAEMFLKLLITNVSDNRCHYILYALNFQKDTRK